MYEALVKKESATCGQKEKKISDATGTNEELPEAQDKATTVAELRQETILSVQFSEHICKPTQSIN